MKKILLALTGVFLFVVATMVATPAQAAGFEYRDLVKLYGPPVPAPTGGLAFRHDDVYIYTSGGSFSSAAVWLQLVRFGRPFSEDQIEDQLEPLGGDEDWVKRDDRDWVLPKARIKAQWDGGSKVLVTAL